MTKEKVWLASLTAPVIIAMLLLLAGSPSVTANDQPSAATVEVKIDNFSFGAADGYGTCRSDSYLDQP